MSLDPLEFHLDHRKADLSFRHHISPNKARPLVFDRWWARELGEARLLESLYMVSVGIRPSSMFHPLSEREVLVFREAAKELGLGMAVRKAGVKVLKVFVYGGEKKDMAGELPDVYENMGGKEFIIAQIGYAGMAAQFLEYPQCCTERFIRHLMNATDQDREAMEMLRRDPPPFAHAYFAERFVPCEPGCERAAEMGKAMERKLEQKDGSLARKYRALKEEHLADVRQGKILREKERDLE